MEVTGIVTAFMPTLYVIRQAIRRNANLIIAHEGAFFSHHDQEGQGPSKWNTYQEETYRLSKRLYGITSICFVLRQKVHIKGFSYQKNNRAYEQNRAVENDRIYGDTFTLAESGVEGIGNNVSLVFEQLDFGTEGATRLTVCGRSPMDKNTIHIRFAGSDGESNQLVDFTFSEEYVERTFHLEKVTGLQNVTFIFLPGSSFDFGWFRFER